MRKLFWKNGRLAWIPVGAFCVTGAAMLLGDYLWRVSSISGGVIAASIGAVALLSAGAVLLGWSRSGRTG